VSDAHNSIEPYERSMKNAAKLKKIRKVKNAHNIKHMLLQSAHYTTAELTPMYSKV